MSLRLLMVEAGYEGAGVCVRCKLTPELPGVLSRGDVHLAGIEALTQHVSEHAERSCELEVVPPRPGADLIDDSGYYGHDTGCDTERGEA